jgi:putative tryptophan/tyrosine transport system permease protein
MIEPILIEGLIYALMVLGVYITFRILDFPDLTVDGTFALGGALAASFIIGNYNIGVALLLAFVGGALAGAVTALIHTRLKVPGLLAGILTMTMLYSINIRIMGQRANLPLVKHETLISDAVNFLSPVPEVYAELIFFIIIIIVVKTLLDLFFHTDLGLSIKALGNNEQMILSQGINPNTLKLIGISLSNGLVALGGAFTAQYQGFADASMGQGIIITGLASVMIGEQLLKTRNFFLLTLCAVIGSIFYKGIMYLGRIYGYMIHLTPNDLKLITGVIIIMLLLLSRSRMIRKAVTGK